MPKPIITRTTNPIHFEDLDPKRFVNGYHFMVNTHFS